MRNFAYAYYGYKHRISIANSVRAVAGIWPAATPAKLSTRLIWRSFLPSILASLPTVNWRSCAPSATVDVRNEWYMDEGLPALGPAKCVRLFARTPLTPTTGSFTAWSCTTTAGTDTCTAMTHSAVDISPPDCFACRRKQPTSASFQFLLASTSAIIPWQIPIPRSLPLFFPICYVSATLSRCIAWECGLLLQTERRGLCTLVTTVGPAKTAKPIDMLFGRQTCESPRKRI